MVLPSVPPGPLCSSPGRCEASPSPCSTVGPEGTRPVLFSSPRGHAWTPADFEGMDGRVRNGRIDSEPGRRAGVEAAVSLTSPAPLLLAGSFVLSRPSGSGSTRAVERVTFKSAFGVSQGSAVSSLSLLSLSLKPKPVLLPVQPHRGNVLRLDSDPGTPDLTLGCRTRWQSSRPVK